MFISKTHLPHLLRPDQYGSQAQHDLEREALFLPAWHFICTLADLPRSGDFLTFDLLDYPLLIRNFDGELHAFLNVCAHRHCRLSGAERGRSPQLKCQYHGWEFDRGGETQKIPDARSFRPFKKGQVGLKKFALETVGQLVFVRLTAEGPDLREFLGPLYDEAETSFSDQWEQVWAWQPLCTGNWKLAYEITLEGYHVQTAHANTLGKFPQADDEDTRHELLSERHSTFRADRSKDRYLFLDLERFAMRSCGGEPSCEYTHVHTYPHLSLISQDMFAIAQSILPVSSNQHVNLYRMFAFRGGRSGPLRWIIRKIARQSLFSLWPRTFQEDVEIVQETQRGMGAPMQAAGGLVSIREERVFHFQQFVKKYCDAPPPVELAERRLVDPQCSDPSQFDRESAPGKASVMGQSPDGHASCPNGNASSDEPTGADGLSPPCDQTGLSDGEAPSK